MAWHLTTSCVSVLIVRSSLLEESYKVLNDVNRFGGGGESCLEGDEGCCDDGDDCCEGRGKDGSAAAVAMVFSEIKTLRNKICGSIHEVCLLHMMCKFVFFY